MGRIVARCAISMLLGKEADPAAGVSGMVRAMLPEAAPRAFALVTIAADAVAESLPRGVRGHLVRGAVLPAAPVCLPRGGERAGRAGALRGGGAAAVPHHEPGRAARGAVRCRHDRERARISDPGVDARQAAAGRGAGRLPRLVLPADAGAARSAEPPLAALVPPVQRAGGAAAHRDRGARGRQALSYQILTRSSGLMYSLSPR